MSKRQMSPWVLPLVLLAVAIAVYYGWQKLKPTGLPDGIAGSNGRIEAVEIDISAKIAGRIREILVDEGDFVTAGQVIAYMDTATLMAERRESDAQLQRAQISVESAESLVKQRQAEQVAAVAVVAQRGAELDAANRKLARSSELAKNDNVSRQVLDDDRARSESAKAAVAAAQADVAATEASISSAKSQVIDAKAAIEVALATIQRIDADIDDSALKTPRDGRVQYRVAEPGEVLSAGGRVLNLVDLGDVYMTFFLPTEQAGRVAYGAEARIVLDAAPQYVIPAAISFVADVAQFTPKTVETAQERQKLTFRIKARIPLALLRKYILQVKTGLPGMAYVKLDPKAEWPQNLQSTIAP